jgi:hypothetical protein
MIPRPTTEELQQVLAQQAVLQELATHLAPSAPQGGTRMGGTRPP